MSCEQGTCHEDLHCQRPGGISQGLEVTCRPEAERTRTEITTEPLIK